MNKNKLKIFSCFLISIILIRNATVNAISYGNWSLYYYNAKPVANEIKDKMSNEMNKYLKIKDKLNDTDNYRDVTFNFKFDNSYSSKWYKSKYGPLISYLGDNVSEAENKTIEFSRQHFDEAKTVFLGNGYVGSGKDSAPFADVKTAATIQNDKPIIINSSNTLSSSVKTELNRLKATNVVVNGGEGVFGRSFGFGNQFNVVRIGGIDRYNTYELSKICNTNIYNPQKPRSNKEDITLINNHAIDSMVEDDLLEYLEQRNMEKVVDILTTKQYGSEYNVRSGTPAIIAGVDNKFFIGYYVKKRGDNNVYYGVYQFINKNYFLPNLRPKIEILDESGSITVDKIEKDKNYMARVEVINDGKEDVNEVFDLGFYIEGAKKSLIDIQGLAKGTSTFIDIPFKGQDILKNQGQVEIKVKVDDSDKIEEIFKDDNWAYTTVSLEDSKPEVTARIIPQKAKCGQRVFLNIKTKNYPDKLIIHLPFADKENPTGKIIIPITPMKILNTRYEYFLPLDLNLQRYRFRVEAIRTKDYRSANDYPLVDVIGSILDNIKTRRK